MRIEHPPIATYNAQLWVNMSRDVERGDLLFWKGHVALVHDAAHILHANARAMAVTLEPINAAIERIEKSGDGPIIAHKRLKG